MNIRILEMPLDFGASRHGSDMGPSAIRLAGVKERLESLGHKTVRYFSPIQINPQEYEAAGNPKAKYLEPIVRANIQLAEEVENLLPAVIFRLFLAATILLPLAQSQACLPLIKRKG